MGQVYRAWNPRLQRQVALKILHEQPTADAARLRRFVAEARAASALNPGVLARPWAFGGIAVAPFPHIEFASYSHRFLKTPVVCAG